MKSKKPKSKPTTPLPSNWKTIALYNCQGEGYCCEISKYADGRFVEPVWVNAIGDWICSVTLVEGEILGLEGEVKVGESIAFAINNKIWC